jgi:hypothetical protein
MRVLLSGMHSARFVLVLEDRAVHFALELCKGLEFL